MYLPTLPTELIDQICSYLETPDFNSLRLTCKGILQKSQRLYGDHHYSTISTIVTNDALQKLQQIACHDTFRICVKELVILPVLFEDHKQLSKAQLSAGLSGRTSYRPGEREDLTGNPYEIYKAIGTDHQDALKSLRSALEDCIPRFVNLDTFKLRTLSTAVIAHERYMRFTSPCLGLKLFRSQISSILGKSRGLCLPGQPKASDSVCDVSARVLALLLQAIIVSNRYIKELDTCLGKMQCKGALANLTLTSDEWKKLIPLMKSVETLHLCTLKEPVETTSYEGFIELLLSCAPNLHTLSMSNCLQYLLKHTEFPVFTRLQHLRLSNITLSLDELISLLRTTAPTLRSLTLNMVKLNDEIETGTTEDNKKEAERLWRIAWAFLRDEFAIQSLHMTGLQYQDIEVRVIDPLRLVGWYTKTSPTEPRLVAYNGQSAPVSFGEWIDSLEMRLALALGSRKSISCVL